MNLKEYIDYRINKVISEVKKNWVRYEEGDKIITVKTVGMSDDDGNDLSIPKGEKGVITHINYNPGFSYGFLTVKFNNKKYGKTLFSPSDKDIKKIN